MAGPLRLATRQRNLGLHGRIKQRIPIAPVYAIVSSFLVAVRIAGVVLFIGFTLLSFILMMCL